MRRMLHYTKHKVIKPVFVLWGEFGEMWEPLPVDKKLAWFLLVNHTVAIITLLEVLLLSKH